MFVFGWQEELGFIGEGKWKGGAAIGGNWLEADADCYPREGNDLNSAVGLDVIDGKWHILKWKVNLGKRAVTGGKIIDEDCSIYKTSWFACAWLFYM